MDNKQLWDKALASIELSVSKANFLTWFKSTYIIKQEEGTVYVAVPSQFVKDWFSEKHHHLILRTLRELSDAVRSVEYIIATEAESIKERPEIREFERPAKPASELPLQDLYVNKEDNLNPRYTFDSFVVGSFNELAHAAAQAVIRNPGSTYNPLFLYGRTGHGKTHLIQAVGNHIKRERTGTKVFYMTSEKFTVDYINSVQNNRVNQFKETYRKYDVLIMDDIQFLSNKDKTQEELFHLFNILYDNNKQIIFSSDRHPNFIPGLEDRLKSRFSAGMIIDIPQPDHDARSAILRSKASALGAFVPDDIIDYLAGAIDGNIRELEGALNAVICHRDLKQRDLSVQEAKNLIKDNVKSKRNIPIPDIIKIVADFYNIEESSIYKKTRKKEVVKPRQLIMYILREDFAIPYPTIGQKLGGRDHTTVIHSYEKIKDDMKDDPALAQEINQIRALL
jgi:chromosomal replication initiator protein